MIPSPAIGIAIPAYNDSENLRRCLNSIAQIQPELLNRTTVVDDSGSGKLFEAFRTEFPMILWKVHGENFGFRRSANDAVFANQADMVVLLNDDTELLSDPTFHLGQYFEDEKTFAVTLQAVDSEGNYREGAKRLIWRFGYPKVLHNPADQRQNQSGQWISDYAVGGHAAFRRKYFVELGGFDPLFDPFYWEDVDLSARAAMKDWITYYEPKCVVRHAGKSAIRSSHKNEIIREITVRNRILFARRHGHTLLRPLLELSLAFQRLTGLVSGNRIIEKAYQAASARIKESK